MIATRSRSPTTGTFFGLDLTQFIEEARIIMWIPGIPAPGIGIPIWEGIREFSSQELGKAAEPADGCGRP